MAKGAAQTNHCAATLDEGDHLQRRLRTSPADPARRFPGRDRKGDRATAGWPGRARSRRIPGAIGTESVAGEDPSPSGSMIVIAAKEADAEERTSSGPGEGDLASKQGGQRVSTSHLNHRCAPRWGVGRAPPRRSGRRHPRCRHHGGAHPGAAFGRPSAVIGSSRSQSACGAATSRTSASRRRWPADSLRTSRSRTRESFSCSALANATVPASRRSSRGRKLDLRPRAARARQSIGWPMRCDWLANGIDRMIEVDVLAAMKKHAPSLA